MTIDASRSGLALAVVLVSTAAATSRAAPEVENPVEAMASAVCIRADTPAGELVASGFAVEPGDRVVTTAHGLEEVDQVRVSLFDGRESTARVEQRDAAADLAVLALAGVRLRPLPFGAISTVAPGDEVTALGCPLGLDFSLTRGVVSAIRDVRGAGRLIQTDVPVSPGSSGGPLLDREGRVVGVIKAAAVGGDRIHFALPVEGARRLLAADEARSRASRLFERALDEPDLEHKIALYREIVDLVPSSLAARHNLALTLERAGREDDAEASYRRVLELDPGFEDAALNLGALLHRGGRPEAAIELYESMRDGDTASPRLRNNLAESYRVAGRAADARREFEAILAVDPHYAPAHYGLARVFDEALGNARQAAVHYRRYLALAPDASDAASVRRRLARLEAARESEGPSR